MLLDKSQILNKTCLKKATKEGKRENVKGRSDMQNSDHRKSETSEVK